MALCDGTLQKQSIDRCTWAIRAATPSLCPLDRSRSQSDEDSKRVLALLPRSHQRSHQRALRSSCLSTRPRQRSHHCAFCSSSARCLGCESSGGISQKIGMLRTQTVNAANLAFAQRVPGVPGLKRYRRKKAIPPCGLSDSLARTHTRPRSSYILLSIYNK